MSKSLDRQCKIEDAVCDAALMAALTVEFVGRALGLDHTKQAPLSEEDQDLLQFAVLQTRLFADKAKAAVLRSDVETAS